MVTDNTETKLQEAKLRAGLKIIKLMQIDLMTAITGRTQLVIEGDALDALLKVVEVAEKATVDKMVELKMEDHG